MSIHHAKKRGRRHDHGYHYFFPDWKEELGWFNLGENMWAKEPGEGECTTTLHDVKTKRAFRRRLKKMGRRGECIGVCFRLASWWEGHDELTGIVKAPKKRRT